LNFTESVFWCAVAGRWEGHVQLLSTALPLCQAQVRSDIKGRGIAVGSLHW